MRLFAFLISCVLFGSVGMAAPSRLAPAEQVERGRADFMENCAVCHGKTGVGDGPLSNFLNVPVPNVTQLSAYNDGVFPAKKVRWIIDGRADVIAHGPRDMPVWGYEFLKEPETGDLPEMQPTPRDIENRVEDLVVYLMSVQVAP